MSPEKFIQMIYHDLRAPLRAMKEVPSWLEDELSLQFDPVPENLLELLDLMRVQSTRLDSILVGLAELASLKRSDHQPSTCIQDALPDDGWPEQLVCQFDVEKLPLEREHAKLIISHLVSNAFKHANAAARSAELTISDVPQGVCIAVKDFGDGIGPEHIPKAYEPLTTLKSRDEVEGSGMGLAVVKRISELYSGSCDIQLNPLGSGLTSRVVIPAN